MKKQTVALFDEETWKPHLAAFAPLSEAFVEHIFGYSSELKPFPVPVIKPQRSVDQTWLHIQRSRQLVSFFLVPAMSAQLDQDRITPRWFRSQFEIYMKRPVPLPITTVQRWTNQHLLRAMAHGTLEPNSVAAIFMMRYLFKDDFRNWLPVSQNPESPWFYVWGVMPGEFAPARMYPYPLPESLPSNLLLYTQWIGASWYPGFVSVPGVGALGWGKTKTYAGQWYWDLSEDEMSTWDASFVRMTSMKHRHTLLAPIIASQQQGFPDAEEYYLLSRTHRLAQLLLEHMGEPILADYMRHYFSGNKTPEKLFVPI